MSFDPANLPKIVIFQEGVRSHGYSHAADIVIDHTGRVIKDRSGKFGMARRDEMEAATVVTPEMAAEASRYFRDKARINIERWLEIRRERGQ